MALCPEAHGQLPSEAPALTGCACCYAVHAAVGAMQTSVVNRQVRNEPQELTRLGTERDRGFSRPNARTPSGIVTLTRLATVSVTACPWAEQNQIVSAGAHVVSDLICMCASTLPFTFTRPTDSCSPLGKHVTTARLVETLRC